MSEPYWVPLGATGGMVDPAGYGTSLPATPVDGEDFVLVDSLTAPTYSWRFRYVAAKATNKWIFIGGSPKVAEVPTSEGTTSTSYADLATDGPTLTIPVTGDYDIHGEAGATVSGATITPYFGIFVNAVVQREVANFLSAGGGIAGVGLARPGGNVTVSALAGYIVKVRYKTSSGTSTFMTRRLEICPVAVGG
jgi:hypothetical protein